MSSLVVVRHGRTAANAQGLLLGRLDVELDPLGRAQVRALAAAVRATSAPIVAVVSSPLRRAVETAESFGLPVTIDERFIEVDYGAFDGTPVADVDPETWQEWRADPYFCPPGGESLHDVDSRVAAACEDWAQRTGDGCVVIATHVSPLKAAVGWALGTEVAWSCHVDTASISRIDVAGATARLRSFNETGHLFGVVADGAS
ncbi:MAG TPA: histidine phosphatase family protein [Microthrixaceae bacterium]|nr:histidine phosphatase family protein [Microthrixaceae bacterium]